MKTKSPLVPKSGPVCLSPSMITFSLALLLPCRVVDSKATLSTLYLIPAIFWACLRAYYLFG